MLFSLEKRGLLRRGINYEISQSRCDLAKKFAELLSCSNVEIKNCNFMDDVSKQNEFDCIIMVDIVWQLISPLYDSAEHDMMQWLRKALKQGGYLFIEMIDYADIMRRIEKEGTLRTWIEFPEGDPFQYSLDKFSVDMDNNLVCEKFFIGRNNNVRDYFKNVIRSYTVEEITELLIKNGFDTKIYPCYDESLPEIEKDSTFRVLAKKLS